MSRHDPTASLTVDVDGEAGLLDGGRSAERLLTSRSERAYGIARGLPRILDLLAVEAVPATFYVPGVVARGHPEAVTRIVDQNHELAHHGHLHLPTAALTPQGERAEIEDGLAALRAVTAQPIVGYRSPGWELTPVTLDLLRSLGFRYDSSLMGDDRPYLLDTERALVELPVHWTLDDAPHFAAMVHPDRVLDLWRKELATAARERRHITFTVHPEIVGRPHRMALLDGLLDEGARRGVRWTTHSAAATAALA